MDASHWLDVADPAAVEGDKKQRMMAFGQAFSVLENRLNVFVS
jgi:hypothetical protein